MINKTASLLIILSIVACGTKDTKRGHQIEDYMSTFPRLSGEEVRFDAGFLAYNQFDNWQEYFNQSNIKLLVTIISDCTPCVLIIKEWDQYLKDHSYLNNTPILFVASGKFDEYMHFQINLENKFDFPVLLDTNMVFMNENQLSDYPKGVFLLDGNNEIILAGSPLEDPQIEKYFKYLILDK